jgi:hypothetical protein
MNSYHSVYAFLRWNHAGNSFFDALRNCSQVLSIAIGLCLANNASGAASLLFDNGPVFDTTSRCDSGPNTCGGSGTWAYYDNFNLSTPANITGFDYIDSVTSGSTANYVATNWSLWNADPFTAGGPMASGSSVAASVPTSGGRLFTVAGLNQALPAGVFWLGINNNMLNKDVTSPARAAGVLLGARQSDGVSFFFTDVPDRVFRIYGESIPEPDGCTLLIAGVVTSGSLGSRARRR